MELWVRSQDKEILTKVNFLEVYGSSTDWWIMGNDNDLGTYKSKERAFEVLDEMQDFLSGREAMEKMNKLGGNINNIFPTMIYIMPEE